MYLCIHVCVAYMHLQGSEVMFGTAGSRRSSATEAHADSLQHCESGELVLEHDGCEPPEQHHLSDGKGGSLQPGLEGAVGSDFAVHDDSPVPSPEPSPSIVSRCPRLHSMYPKPGQMIQSCSDCSLDAATLVYLNLCFASFGSQG